MNSVLRPQMDAQHKKALKSISLELRHLLEGSYDNAGQWYPGDLEQRLAGIGVRRDREPVGVDELSHLPHADQKARQVVDAYLELRAVERNSFRSPADGTAPPDEIRSPLPPNGMNSVLRQEAVAEFVRETAYTWANRLLALRCMEARELIDEVILQKAAYGGRSLEHHRLAQRQPELCTGEDDGLLAVLDQVFAEQTRHLPMLFDPESPGVALRPSAAAIKRCVTLLSESQKIGDQTIDTTDVFRAPDAFGWAYQYWNSEEKDRVFENVRTKKGAKIEGANIIPATQLYTEPYMVKFLVQNSLGATWMGMHPESQLAENWEYYVRDADRVERNSFRSPKDTASSSENERNEFRSTKKPVAEITFLDPACGSGHFLIEAFDLFYEMYEDEGLLTDPDAICRSILENNLFGIDIDARAVQIAETALWMKAAERAFGFEGKPTNLVAAVVSHLKGPLWEEFLAGFEQEPSIGRVLRKFGQAMEHIDQLGSLARPDQELREIVKEEHELWERQVRERRDANFLFSEMTADALSGQLPFREMTGEEFGEQMLDRARAAIHNFSEQARQAGTFQDQFLGHEASAGFKLLNVLSRRYDVVAANPPYMGSKNMGPVLRKYVERHYAAGKRDLYAAFILRCLDLAAVERNSFRSPECNTVERNSFRSPENNTVERNSFRSGSAASPEKQERNEFRSTFCGRVAMVTQQSWMFLRSFAELRAADQDRLERLPSDAFRGLLRDATLETLAHLGEHAFEDSAAAGAFVVLFSLSNTCPSADHRLTAFRLIGPKSPEEKDALLRQALRGQAAAATM